MGEWSRSWSLLLLRPVTFRNSVRFVGRCTCRPAEWKFPVGGCSQGKDSLCFLLAVHLLLSLFPVLFIKCLEYFMVMVNCVAPLATNFFMAAVWNINFQLCWMLVFSYFVSGNCFVTCLSDGISLPAIIVYWLSTWLLPCKVVHKLFLVNLAFLNLWNQITGYILWFTLSHYLCAYI